MAAVTWGSSSVTDNDDRAAADDIEVHDDNVDDDCDDIVTIAGEYSSPSVIVPLSDDSLLPALPMEPPPASRSKKLREKITIPNHDDKRFWTPSGKTTHSSYPRCLFLNGSEVPPSATKLFSSLVPSLSFNLMGDIWCVLKPTEYLCFEMRCWLWWLYHLQMTSWHGKCSQWAVRR